MSGFTLKKILKICGLGILISLFVFLFVIIFKFIAIPITEYPFYFTGLCHGSSDVIPEGKQAFLLTDENEEPLKCKKIRVEEESLCIESPCPDFSVIRRLTTSKEGTITVPKNIFDDIVYSFVDGPKTEEHIESKAFLFHSEGNYNSVVTYKEINAEAANQGPMKLMMTQKSEERCNHPRSSYKRNYCDGH